MKSVMVFGASGMLGHRIVRQMAKSRPVIAVMRAGPRPPRLDQLLSAARQIERVEFNSAAAINQLLERHLPDVVVNAAGLIKQRPASIDAVAMIEANALLPHRLAASARAHSARLIHISSDCVFNGTRGNYREDNLTDAVNLYGRTKALGEPVNGTLTLRTSIIGPECGSAYGLLEWLRSRAGQTVQGYRQVIFPGLPTIRVAMLLEWLIETFPSLKGLYHVGAAPIAKHDLLTLINSRYGLNARIEAVDEPVSDRSLDCTRFHQTTGFVAEPWPELVHMMARDEESETSVDASGR